ncbi:MAG: class I SAM-dependent methyltransferase [Bacteroidales bacterium]|nr:class I SAM-dependent methyltransferase [Bacteroidales bacterium]
MRIQLQNYRIALLFIALQLISSIASCQESKDPFSGLEDEKILPMLKYLPLQYGGMNVPPSDGRLLYDLIIDNGYKRGLEIGTSNGYSALWQGLAFQKNGGSMITLEIEKKRAKEAQGNFKSAGLDEVIESRVNDALKEIPKLDGQFDFVFIDAWKPDYMQYLELIRDKMKPGGVITAHNVRNAGRDMQDFLDAIKTDPGLDTKIVNSSSSGVSVSFVKSTKK